MLNTAFQLIFAFFASFITALRIFTSDPQAYPTATGDGVWLHFIFVVGVLGVIAALVGLLSLTNFFTKCANKGHKRRFCRNTSTYIDAIFIALALIAFIVSKDTLSHIITPFFLLFHDEADPSGGPGPSHDPMGSHELLWKHGYQPGLLTPNGGFNHDYPGWYRGVHMPGYGMASHKETGVEICNRQTCLGNV